MDFLQKVEHLFAILVEESPNGLLILGVENFIFDELHQLAPGFVLLSFEHVVKYLTVFCFVGFDCGYQGR